MSMDYLKFFNRDLWVSSSNESKSINVVINIVLILASHQTSLTVTFQQHLNSEPVVGCGWTEKRQGRIPTAVCRQWICVESFLKIIVCV